MKEICLYGSNFEIGKQHGLLLKNKIHSFLMDDYFQINKLCGKSINVSNITEYVEGYHKTIQLHLPDIYEEICGLANGTEISIENALLLQIRREIIGTRSFTLVGDCSSLGVHNSNTIVSAQTIDLNGDMTGLGQVFKIKPLNKNNLEIIQYSFAGLLGYMGMNNFGLAVTINLVISDGWKIGVPPYLLVRKFLECNTIDECIEWINKIPIASSRSFIIQDKDRQIILEITPEKYRILESDLLTHTNHFLHEDLKRIDKLNIFSKNSSAKRLKVLNEGLMTGHQLNDIKSLFNNHSVYPVGICAHNESNFQWSETVAAAIMFPGKGEFYALKGKPCKEKYELFKI